MPHSSFPTPAGDVSLILKQKIVLVYQNIYLTWLLVDVYVWTDLGEIMSLFEYDPLRPKFYMTVYLY